MVVTRTTLSSVTTHFAGCDSYRMMPQPMMTQSLVRGSSRRPTLLMHASAQMIQTTWRDRMVCRTFVLQRHTSLWAVRRIHLFAKRARVVHAQQASECDVAACHIQRAWRENQNNPCRKVAHLRKRLRESRHAVCELKRTLDSVHRACEWARCPISQELISCPVWNVVDGRLYERRALHKWLRISATSPMTRASTTAADICTFGRAHERLESDHTQASGLRKHVERLDQVMHMCKTFGCSDCSRKFHRNNYPSLQSLLEAYRNHRRVH